MLDNLKSALKHPRGAYALRGRTYNLDVLFYGSHVAVYPELNLCFNRIKKSGNTTVSAFLNDLSNGFAETSGPGFKKKLLTPRQMTSNDLRRIADYYSFVVVRDPFSRTLSAFLQKVAHGRSAQYSYCAGFGNSTPEGFLAFLQFLDEGGRRRDRHFWPQSDLLFQPLAQFNHVAKLETLVADMRIVLSAVGQDSTHASRLARPHDVEAGSTKITAASDKLTKYYTKPAVELVRKLYATDFLQFGYPIDKNPLAA